MRATGLAASAFLLACCAVHASALAAGPAPSVPVVHGSRNAPVTFTADHVQYDKTNGVVTATGHVVAWQNDQELRADKLVYDRTTNVMAASGHVQLLEPDGQIVFSDYAELTSDMREGVLRDMRALLAANGRLAANGGRRTVGQLNELSRAVYSTCNLCKKHPNRAPLWELRARRAVQDVPNKRIEYHDAWLDIFGLPVLYLPYFTHPDPSVKRASGLLVPFIGSSTHLGVFGSVPYYWVIDPSSDATFIPLIASRNSESLETIYRRDFNNGALHADGSIANDAGEFEGHLFADARFNINDTWRYGADVNVVSSENYLRDFRIGNYTNNVLNTQVYAEGFGEGAYARVSALSYQGLNSTVTNSQLPFVLPRFQYNYFGLPDAVGGRISVDSNDFNVVRRIGTNDQRFSFGAQWERPGVGRWGDVWSVTVRIDSEAYNAYDLNQQPNYGSVSNINTAVALPTLAFKLSWPLLRSWKGGSNLVLEPIVQLIASSNTGSSFYSKLPNEDSLTPEFTDSTLFSLNRFQGIDRQEGGMRANVGLHATYTSAAGVFDGLIGQSYRLHADDVVPQYVGLGEHTSDYVGRITYTPSTFFDLTARARLDHSNFNVHFAEAVGSFGPSWLRLSGGYLYALNTPYFLDYIPAQGNPDTPRNEVEISAATRHGNWRLSGYARRDLQTEQMVDAGADLAYENECAIFDVKFDKRYTSINDDHGDSAILFQITLKTVGAFGFHAS